MLVSRDLLISWSCLEDLLGCSAAFWDRSALVEEVEYGEEEEEEEEEQ